MFVLLSRSDAPNTGVKCTFPINNLKKKNVKIERRKNGSQRVIRYEPFLVRPRGG